MKIAASVLAEIEEHAREAAPDECCGLLVGTADAIIEAVRARNAAQEPHRRYQIEATDHFEAIRRARLQSLQVIGAYHSHPKSSPIPSKTDLEQAFENFLFVIVGQPSTTRAWRFSSGNFVEVPLVRLQ